MTARLQGECSSTELIGRKIYLLRLNNDNCKYLFEKSFHLSFVVVNPIIRIGQSYTLLNIPWLGQEGFEPPMPEATDLQSAEQPVARLTHKNHLSNWTPAIIVYASTYLTPHKVHLLRQGLKEDRFYTSYVTTIASNALPPYIGFHFLPTTFRIMVESYCW